MANSRLEWKVGLFVALCLALAALLILKFSKGTSLFVSTYDLYLKTHDVGGIRRGAGVFMAGVRVGNVDTVTLDPGGKLVTMGVKILNQYQIYSNAKFTIEQSGFLGDQFIAIEPRPKREKLLKSGDEVWCEAPFNMQAVARSGSDLIRQFTQTAAKLDESISRINDTLLSGESLTNLSTGVRNFRLISERALGTLRRIDALAETNSHPLSITMSNLAVFSDDLNRLATELQEIVATNRVEITAVVKNVESATLKIDKVLADLQEGVGLAGSLLRSKELEQQFRATLANLTTLSSNLTKYGLLYKPKPRRETPIAKPVYQGKNPFD